MKANQELDGGRGGQDPVPGGTHFPEGAPKYIECLSKVRGGIWKP